MPIYVGTNQKYRVKVKEPVKGSKRYLHPSAVGMEISSWYTKKEAKQGERELEKLVKEMYTPTMGTTLDLISLCNKFMESLPPTMNEETVKAKQHFCEEILKKWGNIEVVELKVFQVQEFLEDRIKNCSVNSFNVYKKTWFCTVQFCNQTAAFTSWFDQRFSSCGQETTRA